MRVPLKKFGAEVLMKPCEPLGAGCLFPCASGNWAGAMKQYMGWSFIFASLTNTLLCMLELRHPVEFLFDLGLFYVLLSQLWFTLTQRKPSGSPASIFGACAAPPIAFFVWCSIMLYKVYPMEPGDEQAGGVILMMFMMIPVV